MNADQNVKIADEAAATAAPKTPIVEFPVSGRISVRGDGAAQASYNLLVLTPEAHDALLALTEFSEFNTMQPCDSQGQSWISVTIDNAGKAKMRQAARQGATKLVVEGVVTLVDIVNDKPQGFMRVTGARPATLVDGGRIVTRESREPAAPQTAMPSLGLRGRARA